MIIKTETATFFLLLAGATAVFMASLLTLGKLSLDELLKHVYSLDEVRGRDPGEEIL
jgi:hypothetical protein